MKIELNPKVSEWLLEQPWRGQFIDNCIKNGSTPSYILRMILGYNGDTTIDEAFIWIDTQEGSDFWSTLDSELRKKFREGNWDDYWKKIEI